MNFLYSTEKESKGQNAAAKLRTGDSGITDNHHQFKKFPQLALSGAKIQWLKDAQGLPGGGGGDNNGTPENGCHADLAALYNIVAVFPSPLAAQNASLLLNNSMSHFKLRVAKKNYDLRILE
ncbi:R3H domain-containing protein 2 [Camelus dromedarius]|uniref:R3H domain-containing protein 2 n=1 Tax=Camelus dromedarius TaxID=9838 RepID=A0A5N4C4P3_CAMDR|nr:R3H domain-containing protein 2 [Camelus dromedarius]